MSSAPAAPVEEAPEPGTVQPDQMVPPGSPVVQNYYEANFWSLCNATVSNFFTLLINLLATPAGWFGMIIVYILYCLLTGRKFVE